MNMYKRCRSNIQSVLLHYMIHIYCISVHRESGYDSEVDFIVKLIWSKVCIAISITSLITIVAQARLRIITQLQDCG